MFSCPMDSTIFTDKAHVLIDSIFVTNFLIGIFGSSFWWAFLIGGRMEDFYYWKNEVED